VPTYSQLAYRTLDPAKLPPAATIVVLHGHNGGHDELLPLAQSLGSDLRIVAPAAARGVYHGLDVIGQTWYGGPLVRPEAASFGDSLAQLERFLYDVRTRAGEGSAPPWLLGVDQGAVLALSLAAILPDQLAGVMAIGGCLPVFSDPTLIDAVASTIPILIVGDPLAEVPPVGRVEATVARFMELGAQVSATWLDGAESLGPEVGDRLRSWLREHVQAST
jgi:predicted esterase